MIEIRKIDNSHRKDINIPNEPFRLYGRLLPSYIDGKWNCQAAYFAETDIREMRFPDENYDYEKMCADHIFIGAYDAETCIGLAILRHNWNKYIYLYDLKVNSAYRKQGVGRLLIKKSREIAREQGYHGVYTQGQDNNLGACLFYLKNGFCVRGIDTWVYTGTSQEGKADILFYLDNSEL